MIALINPEKFAILVAADVIQLLGILITAWATKQIY